MDSASCPDSPFALGPFHPVWSWVYIPKCANYTPEASGEIALRNSSVLNAYLFRRISLKNSSAVYSMNMVQIILLKLAIWKLF